MNITVLPGEGPTVTLRWRADTDGRLMEGEISMPVDSEFAGKPHAWWAERRGKTIVLDDNGKAS